MGAAAGDRDYDVLVCGLGPVGLLLALLLGRAGVSVLAIDAAPEPFMLPRAAVVDDEVLRIFQSAGVAGEILAASQIQEDVSFVPERGNPYTILRPVDGIHGHPPLVSIHQPTLERTLADALAAEPTVEMRRGVRLEDFEQDGSGIEAKLRSQDDGESMIRASWLVGCDGGPSWVRRLLGIEFGGFTFRQQWLVVDVLVDRPVERVPHPHFFGDWRRPIVSLPMSPGRHRWEWMLHPGEDPEPFTGEESVRQRLEPWFADGGFEVERAVVYTFHARAATRWREGRVFLAGDAAHLMPPFAGQGFSSGARDAANLAWKLAAVTRGAPESLLGSYESERRPHVQAMTRLALLMGRFIQTTDRKVAAIRDAFLGTLDRTGIAELIRERIKPVPAYDDGAFAEGPHRLPFKRSVGSQFPQPEVVADGESFLLDELLGRGWSAVALDASAAGRLGESGFPVLVAGRDFEDGSGVVAEWMERFGASWVLLRPDRFVFAAGTTEGDAIERSLGVLHRQAGNAPAAGPERRPEAVAA